MIPRENVSLKELTTFHLGGPARYLFECATTSEVSEAKAFAASKNLPYFVLGGGSNVLASDAGYEGVILRMGTPGIAYEKIDDAHTLVTAGAGVSWDALVADAASHSLWGIENLAGIPGTVGAAPVQNIGAYGTELADTLEWVEALSADASEPVRLTRAELGFGYRDSRFKREKGWVILTVALRLATAPSPRLSYADLAKYAAAGKPLSTPAEIGTAVREIRAGKFPDITVTGTAGSFFKNPVLAADVAAALSTAYPGLPVFMTPEGTAKVSLAWLLDRALNLRGFSLGSARLFERQPIVIVAEKGASSGEVDTLAEEVKKRVKEATNIDIEREVRTLS